MKRDDLKDIAQRFPGDSNAMREALLAYLRSPAGRKAVEEGPLWHRGRSAEELVALLMTDLATLGEGN